MKSNFRKKLIEARNARGLTQEELARECNITARTIQRIESGKVKPRAHTIKVISSVLGIDYFNTDKIRDTHSIFWLLKDLFNLKTQKMKKITILTSMTLVMSLAAFLMVNRIQAKPKLNERPESGLTISYNKDMSVKRIDVLFTNTLTKEDLTKIAKTLKDHQIVISYQDLKFDSNQRLVSVECDVSKDSLELGGMATYDVSGSNTGFYIDYSKNAKRRTCFGACW